MVVCVKSLMILNLNGYACHLWCAALCTANWSWFCPYMYWAVVHDDVALLLKLCSASMCGINDKLSSV